MLGFATIDYSATDHTVAVWHTSNSAGTVSHSNAVVFTQETLDTSRINQMSADRYVIFTPRTLESPGVLLGASLKPVDIEGLREDAQRLADLVGSAKARVALPQYRYADLPNQGPSNEVALAAANYVRSVWTAWLQAEKERAQRVDPAEPDAMVRELPENFTNYFAPHSI